MASRRILLFDLAKAIAIIAVIVSHTAIRFSGIPSVGAGAPTILAACFTFHLPLFFIVSGYFLHTNSRVDLKKRNKATNSALCHYLHFRSHRNGVRQHAVGACAFKSHAHF